MKFIGQFIQSLVSRFRNDVFLENISSGTIASGGNLGLDSNNKIVKANEATGDITRVQFTADTTEVIQQNSGNADFTISGGNAIGTDINDSTGAIEINHDDTSSQASVNNSGRTYIQDITLDTYGHVTGLTSATETVTDTNTNQLTEFNLAGDSGDNQTISHGNTLSITGGGGITTETAATDSIRISHNDTSSQASVDNSGSTYIQDITLDTYGHVTGLTSAAVPTLNQNTTGSAATLTTVLIALPPAISKVLP